MPHEHGRSPQIGNPEQQEFSTEHLSRNMLNHPMVHKDYVFTSNFAVYFRYNERALVYSGLLARNTAFFGRKRWYSKVKAQLLPHATATAPVGAAAGESVGFRLKDRPQ